MLSVSLGMGLLGTRVVPPCRPKHGGVGSRNPSAAGALDLVCPAAAPCRLVPALSEGGKALPGPALPGPAPN